jgi:hypothetical protein
MDISATKKRLNAAFRALRKAGYTAKQNFWCCQSCAWNALTDEEAEKAVFYHRQDNDRFKVDGECYLAWSGSGVEIVSILEKAGLTVTWNGEAGQRIMIQ